MWCFTVADRAMSRPSVELCVGMKLRPARNRWSEAATWMQRTGTLATGSTAVMKRTPRAVNVRAPRSLCSSFFRSSRNTSSSVLNVSVKQVEEPSFRPGTRVRDIRTR
jgi:hypothetical protein